MSHAVWASIPQASVWEAAVGHLVAHGEQATTYVVAAWIGFGLLAAALSMVGLSRRLEWVFKVIVGLWVPITLFGLGSAKAVTATAKIRVIEVPANASLGDDLTGLRGLLIDDTLCRNTISLILDVSKAGDVSGLTSLIRDLPRAQVGCGAAMLFYAGSAPDQGQWAAVRDIATVSRDASLGEVVLRESKRWGADHVITIRQE